jgi:hypothetical protein
LDLAGGRLAHILQKIDLSYPKSALYTECLSVR